MTKINFIGIGVQKAGTSWLSQCLNEHPDIYIHPEKERHFFNKGKFYLNKYHYEYSFKHNNQKIIGEITPSYISEVEVAGRIFRYNPNVKIIAILRDPTARCVSQYKMEMSRGTIEENSGLWDAFKRDLPKYGPMKSRGMYKQQLEIYYKYFKSEQILILDYEEIQSNPKILIKKTFDFLRVDNTFSPKCLTINIKHKKDKRKEVNIIEEDIKKIREYYNNYDSLFTTDS